MTGNRTSWVSTSLGTIAMMLNGDRGKDYPSKQFRVDTGVPFINAGHLVSGKIDYTEMDFIAEDHFQRLGGGKVEPGDILYCLRGSLGKAACVGEGERGAIASSLLIIRPLQRQLQRYIYYFLISPLGTHLISKYDNGTAQPNLSAKSVADYEIPLAPQSERGRIVDAIESYFTRLDDAVATLKRVERNLERYRASVLKAAVEGRLVTTEAALAKQECRTYESGSVLLQHILTERRRRWVESGKKSKYEDPTLPDETKLHALPEGWCWTTMSALIVEGPQNGIYVPKSQYGSGTPILRINDYQVDWSRPAGELQMVKISDQDAKVYGLHANDLVINRVNSPSHLGKSLLVMERNLPSVFESNMMRLSLAAAVDGRYVQHYLSSFDGKRRLIENAKWAVNQASINQRDVECTPIPLPPLAEQRRIAEEISRSVSASYASSALIKSNILRCQRLRQATLQWAFEGHLADQDPADEPASALLDRIKSERETLKPEKSLRGVRTAKKQQVRA